MNFTQNSIFALIGKIFSSILALIISVIIARGIGPEGVGQYQLVISTQTIFLTILAMGFGNASIYFINSYKSSKTVIISNLIKIFSIISIFLSLLIAILLLSYRDYFGELLTPTIIIFSISTGSLLLYNILFPSFYANFEIIRIQVITIISSLILLFGVSFFYFTQELSIDICLFMYGIGNIVMTYILILSLKKNINFKVKVDKGLIKKMFFYGIKISATNLAFILSSNIIIFLMKFLIKDNGFEAVGLFSRAYAIASLIYIIPSTLGPLLYARWSQTHIDKLHIEVENTIRIVLFFVSCCSTAVIIFDEKIIILLYGIEFIDARDSLIILTVSIIFSSITMVYTNVFSSIGKPTIMLKVFISSLVISILISFILIPILGINGGAFAVLFGVFFNTIALSIYSKREINLNLKKTLLISKSDITLLLKSLTNK